MIARFLSYWRERAARKKLDQIVKQTAESYEIRRYRERRAAALKGRQSSPMMQGEGR